ncbi:FG-GAP-like repeat-containing protein [candidate division KSB1 bacterium]|nr:FG-GAP-like repeat-containing protein [candidate division KSB1 bacterium]
MKASPRAKANGGFVSCLGVSAAVLFAVFELPAQTFVPLDTNAPAAENSRGRRAESGFTAIISPPATDSLFTEVPHTIRNLSRGSVAWGDYDNDGDLDLLISGDDFPERYTGIYRNDDTTFVEIGAGLIGISDGRAIWGDYDNDGDLDILLVGFSDAGPITKLYRNDADQFVPLEAAFENVRNSAVAWGDYDNDGDLDILLAGFKDALTKITKLYRNENGDFVETPVVLPGIGDGSLAWGDFDNDGDLDILLSGQAGNSTLDGITKVYRNDNAGEAFVDIEAGLGGAFFSSAAFGDFDDDGDLDILLTGKTDQGAITRIYRNDAGAFVDLQAPIHQVGGGVVWGDYDNDGDLDVLMSGYNELDSTFVARVYNNTEGSFVEIGAEFAGGDFAAVAWGDYDNDGDLDFVQLGLNYYTGAFTKLFRNEIGIHNTAPTPPAGLVASVAGDSLILSWERAADLQTRQEALTYNLRAGTTPGGAEIVSPMADLQTGRRLQPQLGNVNHNTRWVIKNFKGGKIYWSVQAIDHGFAGSTFADEQIITSVAQPEESIPAQFTLFQNYPNPFNPSTVISYAIPATGRGVHVRLDIFNALGQKVRTVVDEVQVPGHHKTLWDTRDDRGDKLPSGLYLARLRAGHRVEMRKLLLLR